MFVATRAIPMPRLSGMSRRSAGATVAREPASRFRPRRCLIWSCGSCCSIVTTLARGSSSRGDWRLFVERLDAFGVGSLLDHEIESWSAERTERGRVPLWTGYGRYAWKALLEFRMRCGVADPWEPDVWHFRGLPIDQLARIGKAGSLDWRPIEPAWLRQLCKRWARHRLREGVSVGHVASVRRAILALVEFCELGGWPLDSPECLTRDLFDAFLDHVRALDQGAVVKHWLAVGVRQLFEQAHDLGWITLRNPRVYLRGELPGFVIISRARCRRRCSSG